MTTMARAAVLPAPNEAFVVQDVELDEPRADEVLVRMVATGLCHTDLGVKAGALPFPMPGILGHEGAGIVERIGSAVTSVSVEDKVLLSFTSCGACESCLSDHPAYCTTWLPRNIFMGSRWDGTATAHRGGADLGSHFFGQSSFAEYAIADERSVTKVDASADLAVLAPLGCGVQTGFGSIWNVLGVTKGSTVAVFGTGAVGLSGIIAAHLSEAAVVIAVDIVEGRLALAGDLGATHTINGSTEDAVARIAQITDGRGLDFALDTTGSPRVARNAIDALGIGGTVAVCGAPPPGTEIAVDIQGILPGKRLVGVTMGDSWPQELIPRLVQLHTDGKLPLEKLIKNYSLDDIEQAAHDMHSGATVKPVIVF
ncbi:alcohol dehydrogenase [Subtercola boreus]|uniref:Alcohol dehydrogenase n=1 Tax=Subtercola boreus TaxID=120213 RepID=A0A3E0VI03_9MICO|nr:NAD(P)-dependent alcohol dehydrogenase [Subtercola boreus]RFA09098.1 alcohol dehydrogenase [Subtercola boreus]TQL53895.1 aryl-alcohol dehydrogenase [Subtercola boreus]